MNSPFPDIWCSKTSEILRRRKKLTSWLRKMSRLAMTLATFCSISELHWQKRYFTADASRPSHCIRQALPSLPPSIAIHSCRSSIFIPVSISDDMVQFSWRRSSSTTDNSDWKRSIQTRNINISIRLDMRSKQKLLIPSRLVIIRKFFSKWCESNAFMYDCLRYQR